eukprot:5181045-Amphidinium_carterae.1
MSKHVNREVCSALGLGVCVLDSPENSHLLLLRWTTARKRSEDPAASQIEEKESRGNPIVGGGFVATALGHQR